jgi:hypothetical protein
VNEGRAYAVPTYCWGIPGLRNSGHPSEPPEESFCTHCRNWFPLQDFCLNPRKRSGLQSWCKRCQVEATRRWREENRDKYNERRRLGERQRDCVDCGDTFAYKHASAIRCPACRRQRKVEQRRALRVA